ncbi:unnamed protein product [Owenia fusiformis]|uniref:Uncharacterized protein n=1 Tax=Owenia fusiformis TaxID=6347 RepID=A0A8J1TXQ5_OWEFU|nr:unnamed protein product [Owenia fusiformis]
MQKAVRINETQLLYLAEKARQENSINGNLYKKSADTGKWQQRWFALYQNLLFYYDSNTSSRPSGVALLEGCYCERLVAPSKGKENEKQYIFCIYYRKEGQRQYELRTDTESECNAWVDGIKQASFSIVLEQKEQLEQKHLHLLQILESERQGKWHYVQQTEELTTEVKKLKNECALTLFQLKNCKNEHRPSNHKVDDDTDESDEIKKIKKVQSFFRGWLCRRRWKQIVDEYIRSEHAESMRKRNSIVFGMVECEEEYVQQLSTLVSCFLRPLKMAASSKKPPITHEDVNSIFLNSETVLFLHQIFYKGLMARMENWPTLVLGDLFDMLLPMLGIYQEYVRNHHYSLQVLAEYKQKLEFNSLLKRYEEKPSCEGRSLETFLTYPMHQIPRYIITLHELLAHTPHDHVERKSLEFAKSKLEELSHIMQEEVSETENIRKNLAIERMIIEGCDILLDVNQTFVRQGSLLQVLIEKPKSGRGRLSPFSQTFKESKKEIVRQVFLFTNHLLITMRANNGRLHLAKHHGKIPLTDCTLVEDSNSDIFFFEDEIPCATVESAGTSQAAPSSQPLLTAEACEQRQQPKLNYQGLDFRIMVDSKSGPPTTIILVASTLQEKAAWCSDVSQCIESLHYSDLLNSSMSDTSSVTMPQSVRYIASTEIWSDPKLFKDDVDIKFSRTLNSCKVPQIRHASVEKLLERLTDLRFMSIDFINTFLLTYRVFTTGHKVLDALRKVYQNPEFGNLENSLALNSMTSFEGISNAESPTESHQEFEMSPPDKHQHFLIKPTPERVRRVSTNGTMRIEVTTTKDPLPPETIKLRDPRESIDSGVDSKRTSIDSRFDYSKRTSMDSRYDTYSKRASMDSRSYDSPYSKRPSMDSRYDTHSKRTSVDSKYESKRTSIDSKCYDMKRVSIDSRKITDDYIEEVPSDRPVTPTSQEVAGLLQPPKSHLAPIAPAESIADTPSESESPQEPSPPPERPSVTCITFTTVPGESSSDNLLSPPVHTTTASSSMETLVDSQGAPSPQQISAAPSSDTLCPGSATNSPGISPYGSPKKSPSKLMQKVKKFDVPPLKIPSVSCMDALALSPTSSPTFARRGTSPSSAPGFDRKATSPILRKPVSKRASSPNLQRGSLPLRRRAPSPVFPSSKKSPVSSPKLQRAPSPIIYSYSTPNLGTKFKTSASGKRPSTMSADADYSGAFSSPRNSVAANPEGSPPQAKAGAVVTSSRASKRRSSSAAAASAFAAATAGCAKSKPGVVPPRGINRYHSGGPADLKPYLYAKKRESVISTAATMRVLNVVRHWVTKHGQDFENDPALKDDVKDLMEEMVFNANLLPAEHKAAASILRQLTREDPNSSKVDLDLLLAPPLKPSKDDFDSLSALDIAEQLTYLDHKIFMAIQSHELLGQSWMKPEKSHMAPHVLLVSKRFNEVSRLVVSEIIGRHGSITDRLACIEKWAAIADICRCMHNYNGVLQICAAFVNCSVYRLKRTWERLPKQTKQMIEKLQTLVSSDGRFKNMRDALHRCDPPCIPYLGMYLTDLSFIEEGTPNFTEESGLANFSKMRMVAHVIREIQLFQQTTYRIEHHPRVTNYLLDPSRLLEEEETYRASLLIEPRQSRISTVTTPTP